jgi:hypothetical protein
VQELLEGPLLLASLPREGFEFPHHAGHHQCACGTDRKGDCCLDGSLLWKDEYKGWGATSVALGVDP